MSHPHFHQHLRKRAYKQLAPFPHPVRWKRRLDQTIMAMGILSVLATFPQMLEIWLNEDAGSVSIISWGYYMVFSIFMAVYGLAHSERPIIITYSLNTITHAAIVVGIVIY